MSHPGISPYDFQEPPKPEIDEAWLPRYQQLLQQQGQRDAEPTAEAAEAKEERPYRPGRPLPRVRNIFAIMTADDMANPRPVRRNAAGLEMDVMSSATSDFHPLQNMFFNGHWHKMQSKTNRLWANWRMAQKQMNICLWAAEELRFHLGDPIAHGLMTRSAEPAPPWPLHPRT